VGEVEPQRRQLQLGVAARDRLAVQAPGSEHRHADREQRAHEHRSGTQPAGDHDHTSEVIGRR